MRKLIYAMFVCSFLCTPLFAEAVHLFKIERSKNANIVQYDVNVSDGEIDATEPIKNYWVLLAKTGEIQDIGAFEKKAYGFKVTYNESGKYYDFTLNAVKDRPIKVHLVKGSPKAEIKINSETAYLEKVYVNSTDGAFGIPKVHYYVLTGISPQTGKEISEKIDVK